MVDGSEGSQKDQKKKRAKRINHYDPLATLDQISRRILQIELANGPGLSAKQIKEIGKIQLDERSINARRAMGNYQKIIDDFSKSAIELILDSQGRAIRKMRDLIDHADPRIALQAAKFFGESARDLQIKRAEFDFEREMANMAANAPPKQHTVKVVMEGGMAVLGQTFLPDIMAQGRPVTPDSGLNDSSGNPQLPKIEDSGKSELPKAEAAEPTSVTAESEDGVLGNPFDT